MIQHFPKGFETGETSLENRGLNPGPRPSQKPQRRIPAPLYSETGKPGNGRGNEPDQFDENLKHESEANGEVDEEEKVSHSRRLFKASRKKFRFHEKRANWRLNSIKVHFTSR